MYVQYILLYYEDVEKNDNINEKTLLKAADQVGIKHNFIKFEYLVISL